MVWFYFNGSHSKKSILLDTEFIRDLSQDSFTVQLIKVSILRVFFYLSLYIVKIINLVQLILNHIFRKFFYITKPFRF